MEKVKCIVVGAGPSGSACALSLARKGIETVLLERASEVGESNTASSVLFTPVLEKIVPEYKEEAPLERKIDEHSFAYLTGDDYMQMRMRFRNHYENDLAYTVFRNRFDNWFAHKAKEAGAELRTGTMANDLIIEDGKVTGVMAGDEEIYADVVVGADGIHTMVGKKAGLVSDDISRYLLGVKEVLELPSGNIEERLQLKRGEGAYLKCLGYPVDDICGAAGLYTNNESVTLSLFGWMDTLKDEGIDLKERLSKLKEHPFMSRLLEGAQPGKLQADIISDGGRINFSNLYSDGVLLCGEAGGFVIYYIGMPTAMLSGLMAAETVATAVKKQDFSARTMSRYISYLENTALARLLYDNRVFSDYLATSGRDDLPGFFNGMMEVISDGIEDEMSFLNTMPYSWAKKFYVNIGETMVPGRMRSGVKTAFQAVESAAALRKKIKTNKKMK